MKYIKTYENSLERFKIGDIVVCTRPADYHFLDKNGVYIVTELNGDLIKIDDYIPFLNRTRFRLADESEIVEYKLKKDTDKYNL